MINSIEIVDKTKSPFSYITDINLPDKIEFSKGVNILVGENGCGKTTILNLLRLYTLCFGEWQTGRNDGVRKLFGPLETEFKDGIKVKGDYTNVTFNLRHDEQMIGDDDRLKNVESFYQSFQSFHSSKGQRNKYSISRLFDIMFGEKTVLTFDFFNYSPYYKDEMNESLHSYYKENHIKSRNTIYTILMDEPDQNMDIENIKQIYCILSSYRRDTQIIASLHNPLLIHKLKNLNDSHIHKNI